MSQKWDKAFLEDFRWGNNQEGKKELERLRILYKKALPLDETSIEMINQINALEICNWKLEDSIIALCEAIGKNLPPKIQIGHKKSVTLERWKKVWAYLLSLKKWLQNGNMDFFSEDMLRSCDPDEIIQNKITELLGTKNKLKELYVTLLYLSIEILNFVNLGSTPYTHPLWIAYRASITEIRNKINDMVGNNEFLKVLTLGNIEGRLQPCSHKVFRRYDIIISSIGDEKWRKSIPVRGTDGFERADLLEKYLFPIQSWVDGKKKPNDYYDEGQFEQIHNLLGDKNDVKVFFASFLVSLLRPQQRRAKLKA